MLILICYRLITIVGFFILSLLHTSFLFNLLKSSSDAIESAQACCNQQWAHTDYNSYHNNLSISTFICHILFVCVIYFLIVPCLKLFFRIYVPFFIKFLPIIIDSILFTIVILYIISTIRIIFGIKVCWVILSYARLAILLVHFRLILPFTSHFSD